MEMNRQLTSNFTLHVFSASSVQVGAVISFMLAQGTFKIGYDVLATGTEKVTLLNRPNYCTCKNIEIGHHSSSVDGCMGCGRGVTGSYSGIVNIKNDLEHFQKIMNTHTLKQIYSYIKNS